MSDPGIRPANATMESTVDALKLARDAILAAASELQTPGETLKTFDEERRSGHRDTSDHLERNRP